MGVDHACGWARTLLDRCFPGAFDAHCPDSPNIVQSMNEGRCRCGISEGKPGNGAKARKHRTVAAGDVPKRRADRMTCLGAVMSQGHRPSTDGGSCYGRSEWRNRSWRPSSTMRILSSAEKCRRVARRMFFTTCVGGSFTGTDFCLIFAPCEGYDEPKILPSSTHPICLTSADGSGMKAR